MPHIHRGSAVSKKKRRSLLYFSATVVMSLVISALLVLILYAVAVRNEHDELQYSIVEPLGQNTDRQVYFPFGQTVDRDSKNATGIVVAGAKGFKCPKRYFLCNSTSTCVELSRRCDGFVDCVGAEDELNCVCAFRLPLAKFCDKYPDCFDESDENFCSYCPANSYNCGNGQCVPRNKVCDSVVDCDNAMDENFCFRLASDIGIASVEGADQKMSKTGFLLRNQRGVWYPMCAAGRDGYMDSLTSYACVSITANPMATSSHQQRKFPHHRAEADPKEYVYHTYGRFVKWNGCLTDEGIFVSCDDFLCGFNPKLLLPRPSQGRIVGGDLSDPGAWPWHAAIYKNGTYACGATLISDQWLLSAAHCFLNYHSNYYEIQLGMLRRRSFTPHTKTYKVSRVVLHEQFNVVTLEFDIVMLKLAEPVTFDFWVRPICLPRPGTVERVGVFCTAIGWGDKGETEDDSDQLREVHVPLTPSCRRSDRWLCAGYAEGGRDACQGDSGGPLMCPQDDGLSWYIAGVISAGTGCARPGIPGMYTRVAYYLDWIRRVSTSKESRDEYPLNACPGWKCSAVGGGNCLDYYKVCDGHVDCYDAQDEVNCIAGRKTRF